MLLQHILSKHVTLIMSNGHVIKGFAHSEEDGYIKIIEANNYEAVVKTDDISVAEVATESTQASSQYPHVQSDNDFAVVAPPSEAGNDVYVNHPEFVRQTPRGKE